jgi:DNA-binding NarL/FixJ family response regulator
MTRSRILLVGMTQMLRGILAELLRREPEFEVVGELSGGMPALVDELRDADVEFLIMGIDNMEPAFCDYLERRPQINVLVIAGDGTRGYLYAAVGELSPRTLVDVLKAHMAGSTDP